MTLFGLTYMLTSGTMPSWKVIYNTIGRDIRASYIFLKLLAYLRRCHSRNQNAVDLFQIIVEKHRDKVCFVYQDHEWTYKMVDELSSKVANFFLSQGYSKGDEVALLMDNCPEYICMWLGLAKIGVVTALINTNLQRESLGHSVNVVDVKAIIFGRNYSDTINDATTFFKNKDTINLYCYTEKAAAEGTVSFQAKSLNVLLEEQSPVLNSSYKREGTFHDKLIYIYTSGTTGLPKAAIIRHSRFLWICAAAQYSCQLKEFETFYNPLPLYHSAGGLVYTSVVLVFGGKMIIRKKFSASNFWKDVVKYKVTVTQYIGEICRYLLNQPKIEEENRHTLRVMFGNGLRPHLWKQFQDRFKVENIIELYGATEGNANLINMFGKVGAVGFVPRIYDRIYPVYLVKVDPETGLVLRNEKGLCIKCKPGEPGELVGKIINNAVNSFDGYVNQVDTKKKIIRDCFDKGDTAFLSGDILVMDEEGYMYFVDRTGDTFRWRGENVSTGEVENVFGTFLNHVSCVVYGVEIPKVEGRAGMVAVHMDPENINFNELYLNACKKLPPYAVPLFVRASSKLEATGTYKLRKVNLQEEGYDPEKISDPLFFVDHKQKTYVPLTKDLFSDIVSGKMKL